MKQGGAERLLLDDVVAQERETAEPRFPGLVVCWNFEGILTEQLRANGVPYLVLNRRLRAIWKLPLFLLDLYRLVGEIKRLAARHNAPIIHGHLIDSTLLATLAARSLKAKSVGTIYSNHVIPMSIPEGSAKRRIWHRLARWSMRHVDRVISISPEVTQSICEGYDVPLSQISERAVMVEPVEMPVARAAARKTMNVAEGELCLIFVGRLVENKNQQCLIRMAAELRKRKIPARLLLVGDGPDMDSLQHLRDQLGAQNYVDLLGHFKDLPLVMSAADMVVTASKSEGVSLALLEAMSANRPILSTSNEGNRELLKDGVGTLVDQSDPEAMATAVAHLWTDTEAREAQVAKARAFYDAYRAEALQAGGNSGVYRALLQQEQVR